MSPHLYPLGKSVSRDPYPSAAVAKDWLRLAKESKFDCECMDLVFAGSECLGSITLEIRIKKRGRIHQSIPGSRCHFFFVDFGGGG